MDKQKKPTKPVKRATPDGPPTWVEGPQFPLDVLKEVEEELQKEQRKDKPDQSKKGTP